MAINGYHINVDLTDVREMVSLLRSSSNSLNQIAKRVNSTNNLHSVDIENIRQDYEKLWDATNDILDGIAKVVEKLN
jgi:uncharacterized protein YoxC